MPWRSACSGRWLSPTSSGPSPQRVSAYGPQLATVPLVAVLGLVVFLALRQLSDGSGGLALVDTLIVCTPMFQTWNLLDLVLLDWFLLMTLKPSFRVIPGTEGTAGYRDHRFHIRQFVNGVALATVLAVPVTLLALAIDRLLG
ncbi:MAG: hypothetical protein OEY70_05005 [Acidimicrobiia bacterium]|nr:hypothetical protein [Acidimicrobiia bacterium]